MSVSPIAVARDARQRALWHRTAAVAGRLNRAQAELVDIVAEVIDDRHWGDAGFKTPEHYLVVRAGLSQPHAADIVRIARRRSELADATAALDAGELSLDQVAVLARHVPVTHQRSVTQFARNATVPHLRRAVSRHGFPAVAPGTSDADGDATIRGAVTAVGGALSPRELVQRELDEARCSLPERRACAAPDLTMSYDSDGRFQLRYSAPATIGALVEQAVKEAKDALFLRRRTAGRAGPADGSQAADGEAAQQRHSGLPTYADALEEMANRSLASITSPSRSAHYRVYLHLDTDGSWVNGGHAIPLRLLTRFVSDGTVQPVWESEGRPVSVGRSMRILPDRTRRLVVDRDRGCRFPGCPTTTGFTEIHHLHAWADGGPTDETNLVSLCTIHHDGVTRGDYTVTGDPTRPDGLTTTTRHGLVIRPPGPHETVAPPGGDPPTPPGTYQPPTGGPVAWADVSLPADREIRELRDHTTGRGPRFTPATPPTPEETSELRARLHREWAEECAASRDPLVRTGWDRS